jgi:hypothetical protein
MGKASPLPVRDLWEDLRLDNRDTLLSTPTPAHHHLHADESASEDKGLLAAFRARPDFSGVVQRTEIADVWQIISRTIKLSRPGTRRDEERFKS